MLILSQRCGTLLSLKVEEVNLLFAVSVAISYFIFRGQGDGNQ